MNRTRRLVLPTKLNMKQDLFYFQKICWSQQPSLTTEITSCSRLQIARDFEARISLRRDFGPSIHFCNKTELISLKLQRNKDLSLEYNHNKIFRVGIYK